LKEEEENERWRPNDESTSPKGLSSHFDSHICCVANENDSESTNEDEEDELSFMQLYAHLSLEDKAVMLKLLKRAREQSEARQMLEDVLSMKMLRFDELTKEHEELKCSHVDLVQRYETISIEQDNSLHCIAQLVNRNVLLKDQVKKLKDENLAFQEKYDMVLCSHKNLMDDHIMLNIAHEVVIENLKSQQPHSCTCIQIETILPCDNACCQSTSKSSFELEFAGTKEDTYQKLKEENERLKMSLTQLKGKCITQPSQDNRDHMVKKLETGTTVACTKSLEENVKDSRIAKRKEQKKKSSKLEDRLCYICRKKGHQCKDCPIGNNPTSSLSIISHVTRQPKIVTCARKVMSLPSANTKDFWVPRSLLTNLDGPIKRWVPKYV
jgi:cell division protein FtsB